MRTVPNDFLDREVQTTTQAARIDRELAAAAAAEERKQREEADKKRVADAKKRAQNARGTGLWSGPSKTLVLANVALVLGVGVAAHYLGADRGRWNVSWKNAGLGVGLATVLGLGESAIVK